MGRKNRLSPDQKTTLDEMLESVCQKQDIRNGAELAELIAPDLRLMADHGDGWCAEIIDRLFVDGLESYCASIFLKRDSGMMAYRDPMTGQKRTRVQTANVGIVAARPTGERYWQQRLWFELSWSEYNQFRRQILRDLNAIAAKNEAFNAVDALHRKHPDTRTPGEACEREGIDPRSFGIEDSDFVRKIG